MEEALEHPYLAELHFEDDEPTTKPVSAFDFDFELYDLEKEDYKQLVYEEVMLYHDGDLYAEYEAEKAQNPNGILHRRFNRIQTVLKPI